jgi:hypothetical protein
MDEFLAELRKEARVLTEASVASDASFLKALNAFAATLAPTIVV